MYDYIVMFVSGLAAGGFTYIIHDNSPPPIVCDLAILVFGTILSVESTVFGKPPFTKLNRSYNTLSGFIVGGIGFFLVYFYFVYY